jgi:hypothetical protein
MFEEWDCLPNADQTWIELRRMIQESFQCRLNATAPMAGGHGYAPAYLNAFGALEDTSDDKDLVATAVASQMAALTHQSQLTASTAATTMQRQEQQLAHLAAVQEATHATLHQIIHGLNMVAFNVSDAGGGQHTRFDGGRAHGPGRSVQGGRYGGRGRALLPARGISTYQGDATGGVPPYCHPAPVHNLPVFPPIGPPGQRVLGLPGFPGAVAPHGTPHLNEQPPYSNTVKRYANWNACYSCGFDVADGHTSMLCPPHLRKATHDINFNRQNAQQYIDLGHPCATRNRHKTQFPPTM